MLALLIVSASYAAATVFGAYHFELRKEVELRKLGADVTMFYCGPDWVPDGLRARISVFDRIAMVRFQSSPKVDNNALVSVVGLEHLYYLDLHDTRIGDDGLRFLSSLQGLQQLNLSQTNITDSGLEQLKDLRKLEIIFVESTNVTQRGRKALRKAIEGCYVSPTDE